MTNFVVPMQSVTILYHFTSQMFPLPSHDVVVRLLHFAQIDFIEGASSSLRVLWSSAFCHVNHCKIFGQIQDGHRTFNTRAQRPTIRPTIWSIQSVHWNSGHMKDLFHGKITPLALLSASCTSNLSSPYVSSYQQGNTKKARQSGWSLSEIASFKWKTSTELSLSGLSQFMRE